MRALGAGDLRYYQFATFSSDELVHGVFARHGGVSRGPYASLNMSVSTGDARENVRANRRAAFRALERDPLSLADAWQVHSAEVVVADEPLGEAPPPPQADALVTHRPEVTLFMRFADCVPVLLFDPERRVVGLAHAGWKGTLSRVAAAAVKVMTERYGSRPSRIVAGIGPSIGPCHYAVGPEVVARVREAFPGAGDDLLRPMNGGCHLDLWATNARVLREAGVEQIEVSGLCTGCRPDEFFSHRAERGRTGRFGALIALR